MKNLVKLRKQRDLTQGVLAKKLGVELNTVWKWENGKITPSVESVKKIADFFNITVDELLNGPAKNELKIEFVWEVEDMDVMNIESNKFNFGFRGNDVLLWGAMPDDADDESVAQAIVRQIRAARIGKKATNEALKKLEG
jgi:transcriptional regulator with XRE-family HTH domain